MFVTSQGSAYGRFRRALATGNLTIIRAAAAELPRVGLQDALEVCLLFREEAGDRFERAAARWLGRFALEGRDVTLEAIQRAAAAFDAMPDRPESSMEALASLCVEHHVSV
jgi:hypothetical protein